MLRKAKNATIIGDVEFADNTNVWYGAVIRADAGPMKIGENSNIQDNCVLHSNISQLTIIGKNVTIGHGAIIHGAIIEDNVMIGMGSTVLDGAVIGEGSIVGANALVPTGKIIPPRSMVLGVPGKIVREVTEEEVQATIKNALWYVEMSKGLEE
ncbi:Protein YrdA [Methanimicrococcus hongohii]|uniref:Protein YrdA n=1 Tax=Methanimicrococcus hongohii TaxID=3028295 RepID=A0AA96ZU44_9EURY|nr:gamma carbonic anhydrase family protein [Methanimicrococcus sp. Hf6]WNY23886.1 Protein YrdA [Methanimicrococcus sp. Hf6]